MSKYTVKAFAPTGKTDPKFGTEFRVVFNEDAREVSLSRKNPVEVGQEENGTIVDGKYGAYFKIDPFVQGAESSAPAGTAPVEQKYVPFKKTDNSDGMRKGMAINNASAFVLATLTEELTPEAWATKVTSYARALYLVSELEEPEVDVENVDMKKTLAALGM